MARDATRPTPGPQTVPAPEVVGRRGRGLPADLIDVRTPAEYAAAHAEGARLVPLDQLDPTAVMAARGGPADEPLYVICKSGSRSARAVERFRAAGFPVAVSVAGGTDAWERAGLPVVRGTTRVISLERQVRVGAGSLVLTGVVLGWLAHPAFLALAALVGAGLVFAGVTDWCGMGLLLARMPWNRGGRDGGACRRGSEAGRA